MHFNLTNLNYFKNRGGWNIALQDAQTFQLHWQSHLIIRATQLMLSLQDLQEREAACRARLVKSFCLHAYTCVCLIVPIFNNFWLISWPSEGAALAPDLITASRFLLGRLR